MPVSSRSSSTPQALTKTGRAPVAKSPQLAASNRSVQPQKNSRSGSEKPRQTTISQSTMTNKKSAPRRETASSSTANFSTPAATKSVATKSVAAKKPATAKNTSLKNVAAKNVEANIASAGASKIATGRTPPKSASKAPTVSHTPSESARDVVEKAATQLPKAKRSRVPKDFADKYSAPQKERKVVAALPIAEKKARKTAQQREQQRQLMTPDDDLVQRLSRVATVKVAPSKPRRKAQWESRCGKCGVTTTFSTPAALCAKCGAIAVRVLD